MEQSAKLESFLLLAKNARGKAAADLIQRATSEPGLFAFSELTQSPGIKELQGTELDDAYRLLEIFCYGTWADYKGMSDRLGLSAAQATKLKQLTIVSMAGNAQKLMYSDLMTQLDIDNIRDLEDLLISECFYSRLISGKLDQKERCVYVTDAAARDVRPEEAQNILNRLLLWLQTSKETLTAIEGGINHIQALSKQAKEAQARADNQIAQAKAKMLPAGKIGGNELMDVEEPMTSTLTEPSRKSMGGREAGSKRRR